MNFERQLELNQLMHVYHFALRTISKELKMIEVATDRFDVWIDEIEKFLAKVPPEIEGELDAHRPQEGPPLLEACSQLSGCCRTHRRGGASHHPAPHKVGTWPQIEVLDALMPPTSQLQIESPGMKPKRQGVRFPLTGHQIREARLALGLTQEALGARAGFHRQCIVRLESYGSLGVLRSSEVSTRAVVKALALPSDVLFPAANAHARPRVMEWLLQVDAQAEAVAHAKSEATMSRRKLREARRQAWRADLEALPKRLRPVCGARNRRGKPCQSKKLLRGGRCKLHGGMSTGPKTPEGLARCAEAGRRTAALRRARDRVRQPR